MKKKEWKQVDRPWLLAVEDPQQLGRDIGSGTYNMRNVQHLFAAAAATLRDCMEHETEGQQWASVQVSLTTSVIAAFMFAGNTSDRSIQQHPYYFDCC